ncbi:MAG TPA: hypothetical protein VJT82_13145, partial [Pyrinomonadaceae bacterium]|nr:hypothetical protein [Pyrinomonadaceae bacterium]
MPRMPRPRGLPLRLAALLLFVAADLTNSPAQMSVEQAKALMNRAEVKNAFAFVDTNRAATLAEWSAITEINAPSGKERTRAQYIEKILRGYKLSNIH